MSILNNVLKVCGTIVEGAGRTIVDCAEVIESERKEYRNSDQYLADKAERERLQAEIKASWKKIKENTRDLRKTYQKGE